MNWDFLKNADRIEQVFWIFAVFGTIFFLLRVVMMVMGGFGADSDHGGMDGDTGGGHAGHHDGHDHSDQLEGSDTAFKLVSLNSITGFFMMFGWAGLAAYKDFGLSDFKALAIGVGAGFVTMYLTGLLFKYAVKLTSGGSRFVIAETVGSSASVYLNIPGDGRGKVQLTHKGVNRVIEAVSEDQVEIESFKNVKIVRVVDSNTVAVKKSN